MPIPLIKPFEPVELFRIMHLSYAMADYIFGSDAIAALEKNRQVIERN